MTIFFLIIRLDPMLQFTSRCKDWTRLDVKICFFFQTERAMGALAYPGEGQLGECPMLCKSSPNGFLRRLGFAQWFLSR